MSTMSYPAVLLEFLTKLIRGTCLYVVLCTCTCSLLCRFPLTVHAHRYRWHIRIGMHYVHMSVPASFWQLGLCLSSCLRRAIKEAKKFINYNSLIAQILVIEVVYSVWESGMQISSTHFWVLTLPFFTKKKWAASTANLQNTLLQRALLMILRGHHVPNWRPSKTGKAFESWRDHICMLYSSRKKVVRPPLLRFVRLVRLIHLLQYVLGRFLCIDNNNNMIMFVCH